MLKAVATIRTLTLLLAGMLTADAYATDITVTMPGANPYCSSAPITVNYDGSGNTFTAGNVFTAQLSNSNGSFGAPTIIGTLSSKSATGEITVTFPGTASGTGYRIRIVSSHPSLVGPDNGSDITIATASSPSITIAADPSAMVGEGSVVYFTSSSTEGGSLPTIEWMKNGDVVGTGSSFVLASASAGDEIIATITQDVACHTPPSATSNAIQVNVDPKLTKSNHSWEERAKQPKIGGGFLERSNASGFTISTGSVAKIFIGCGSVPGDTYRKDFWEYNPVTDMWTQRADLGAPSVAHGRYNAVGFSIGAKGYIGTGKTATGVVNDFYEYEQTNNTWIVRKPVPGGPREQAFGFGIASTSRGYVGGGYSTSDLQDVHEFNPASNLWSPKAHFGGGKRRGAAAFSIGTKGYVASGYSATTDMYYNDFWEFDGTTWKQKTSMPGNGRTRASAFALAGYGYVGLGYSSSGYEGQFYQYNVLGNSWVQKPYYPGPSTITHGVGLALGNRAFIYKDGTMTEYKLFTTTAFTSKVCTSEMIPVSYDASGFLFTANNEFKAQISASPAFAVSTTIGSKLSSSSSGIVNATFPASAAGVLYFRIAAFEASASSPYMWTPVEVITVTPVSPSHTIDVVGGSTVCNDVPVTFTSLLEGPGFQWYKNDLPVGADDQSYIDATLANNDMIKAVRTYTEGCKAPVAVTSDAIKMNVRTPARPTIEVKQPNKLESSAAAQYQWFNDGQAISQATGQTYTMTDAGKYKVRITDSGGCVAFSDELIDAFTGLEDEFFKLQVRAYPSPADNDMFLSITDDIVAQGCDFVLMNELGQTVINKQPAQRMNKLDMSDRAPGLYILRVSFGHNTVVRRLLKVH